MANINIAISSDLHKKLKVLAVEQDSTLKALLIETLEKELK